MTKVVFFGTPNFVLPIPQALVSAEGCELLAVVTNPDRPVGRKQILTPSPVKTWAQEHQIPVLTPKKLDADFQSAISNLPRRQAGQQSDIAILAAYGKIIPQSIINLFPKDILVIHPSLLPKYRGASPVQAAIMAGDRETGVSIIKMDERMDHGPIVSQFTELIKPEDTAESLYSRLFQAAAKVLVTILPAWVEGRIEPREQDHSKATYTRLLKKENGLIPQELLGIIAPKRGWTSKCKLGPYNSEPTPENLERFIRAMTPWPGAWTLLHPFDSAQGFEGQAKRLKRLKILKAHLEDGKLILDQIQLEGKKPVSWKQFQQVYQNLEPS